MLSQLYVELYDLFCLELITGKEALKSIKNLCCVGFHQVCGIYVTGCTEVEPPLNLQ